MNSTPSLQSRQDLYELELLEGLAPLAEEELHQVCGTEATVLLDSEPDSITLSCTDHKKLLSLRTIVAVYRVLYYKVPRPHMIVEGGHLRRLQEVIANLRAERSFTSFRVSAAGSDSTAFRKMKAAIAEGSGLLHDEKEGEMLIRFRRSRLKKVFGWEVLLRMTPRPLSARAWRTHNMPGALNATIAAAMMRMTQCTPQDKVLNLMCGSGTLLVERAVLGAYAQLAGVDVSDEAIAIAGAHVPPGTELKKADARQIPYADGTFDVICSDLPWGRLIGSRDQLAELYRKAVSEMTRVAAPAARAVLITQENQLLDAALKSEGQRWKVERTVRVLQSEYKPKMYLLRRE